MVHLLGAEALHLEFPTKVVFGSVTLGPEEGDRIGIVGLASDIPQDATISELSGGQRRRVALTGKGGR